MLKMCLSSTIFEMSLFEYFAKNKNNICPVNSSKGFSSQAIQGFWSARTYIDFFTYQLNTANI